MTIFSTSATLNKEVPSGSVGLSNVVFDYVVAHDVMEAKAKLRAYYMNTFGALVEACCAVLAVNQNLKEKLHEVRYFKMPTRILA